MPVPDPSAKALAQTSAARCALGHLIAGTLSCAGSGLHSGHFPDPLLQSVFLTVHGLERDGLCVTPADIAQRLGEVLEQAGGFMVLVELVRQAHAGPSVTSCIAALCDAWQRRVAIEVASQLRAAAEEVELDTLGITARTSGQRALAKAGERLVGAHALLNAALGPAYPALARDIGLAAKLVLLIPEELQALAASHQEQAMKLAATGDVSNAMLFQDRSNDLATLAAEVMS